MTALLQINAAFAGYGAIEVLKNVSLEVQPGEIVTIIGANGAGKTTTLMCISGINRLRAGSIIFQGQSIDHLPPHEIVRRGLCQSPEGRKIFPRLYRPGKPATRRHHAYTTMPPSPAIWTTFTACFQSFAIAPNNPAARSPAASSKCWPSAAR